MLLSPRDPRRISQLCWAGEGGMEGGRQEPCLVTDTGHTAHQHYSALHQCTLVASGHTERGSALYSSLTVEKHAAVSQSSYQQTAFTTPTNLKLTSNNSFQDSERS